MFDVVVFTHRVCYPAQTLWFYRFQNFKLFGFTIIRFLAYLVLQPSLFSVPDKKVIPETRHAH